MFSLSYSGVTLGNRVLCDTGPEMDDDDEL